MCKYRKKLLINLGDVVKQLILQVLESSDCIVDAIETDKDHLHVMFNTYPNLNLSNLVNKIKSFTTYHIWRVDDTKYLKSNFWKEKTLWSDGYFICTVGNASAETIQKYIESQG